MGLRSGGCPMRRYAGDMPVRGFTNNRYAPYRGNNFIFDNPYPTLSFYHSPSASWVQKTILMQFMHATTAPELGAPSAADSAC